MITRLTSQGAARIVVLFGVVSLLADFTYESARGIIGPYLGMLGASAVAISIVSGAGELVGYGVRLLSGRLADATRNYWLFVWVGYTVNLLAVPLLALAGHWELAAALVIVERLGKAVRTPARDVLLAHATAQIGHGKGFGIHEALDQIGAVVGPLVVAAMLNTTAGSYRSTLAFLLVPALAALGVLGVLFVGNRGQEATSYRQQYALPTSSIPSHYRYFLFGVGFAAAGFADFPLLAYHLHKQGVSDAGIPLLYALAMGADAVAALVLGRLFDRWGIRILALSGVISAISAILVVAGGISAWMGIVAWGMGMGAHESILRASVAFLVPPQQQGTAFGLLSAWYGISWFVGSAVLGMLYQIDPFAMAYGAALLQGIGVTLWLKLRPIEQKSE
ncbi:MAG: MFS transporter [Bacteroidota bacterium]|nr:MFS transporter [Bacteroidota bacterium]